jgi:hypothetical protein
MNRQDWQRLAKLRLADAKALLAAKRWSGAYYLAGYVVECGLKSCVIVRLSREGKIIFEDRKFSEKCWTHGLPELLALAGVRDDLKIAASGDALLNRNWTTVAAWKETSRYQRNTRKKAQELFDAVANKKHGGAAMDYVPLVNEQIEAGKRLLERLVEEGVKVMAACWIKESESSFWELHITSSLVKNGGVLRPALGRILTLIKTMPQPFWIELSDIRLEEPGSSLSKAVQKLMRTNPGKLPRGLGSGSLGDISIDSAYIYAPITVPVQQA